MSIFEEYNRHADQEKAIQMSAYMKNRFTFLGIPKPERKKVSASLLKEKKAHTCIDWPFVKECYDQEFREIHYLAVDHILSMKPYLTVDDFEKLKWCILTHSWWDSVDALSGAIGELFRNHIDIQEKVKIWATSDHMWLRRASIICQLRSKEGTNEEFLCYAIEQNAADQEFFIRKAIGWALREYSKTNPDWVKKALATYSFSPLTVREASKYL
ncbi:DNA alkylation repair protein [Bacillus sp. 1P06AnD]|uniref:DNA alkylation repair protein n=1 Tax=Bacillus sp. 1P06AnD TaxID=3132208 RepID=UPI0039A21693